LFFRHFYNKAGEAIADLLFQVTAIKSIETNIPPTVSHIKVWAVSDHDVSTGSAKALIEQTLGQKFFTKSPCF
jgi:hypothetical protein